MLHDFFRTGSAALLVTVVLSGCTQAGFTPSASSTDPDNRMYGTAAPVATSAAPPAAAESTTEDRRLPTLIVSDDPPPAADEATIAEAAQEIGEVRIDIPTFGTRSIETAVTRKANDLSRDLEQLKTNVGNANTRLKQLQAKNDAAAAEYYAAVASISTELQAGSTPGNPILTERWKIAEKRLNALAQDTGDLNSLANDLTNLASRGNYLLEGTQAAFDLSGAVKEDHKKLTLIEDEATQNITLLNRLLLRVNDEINRRAAYLRAERANLQTLALGVAKGEMYGQNLTNSLFRKATGEASTMKAPVGSVEQTPLAKLGTRRPLIIIRFDRPGVNYDQPLYAAISQALEKYPGAKFDLVAVSNLEGNAAQLALASAEARKNGEQVLRSLNQMGLPLERVRLSAASSKDVLNSEVHIYLQ